MLYTQNHKIAAFYVILSGLLFASMGSCIKLISADVSNELIVFFRNLFGLLALLPILYRNGKLDLKTRKFHLHLLRGIFGLAAMYCYFYSIAHIPLSEAVLMANTVPLFAPVIAYLWLKESLSRRLVVAISIGFIGVILILHPDVNSFSWVALVALLSGFFAAVAMTTIRKMSDTEPTTRIVFYFAFISTVVSSIMLFNVDNWPGAFQFLILILIGIFATGGQMSLTYGYAQAGVAQVGPFMYSNVVFATVLALIFWQEIPDYLSAVGILVVISAGSIVIRSQKTPVKNAG